MSWVSAGVAKYRSRTLSGRVGAAPLAPVGTVRGMRRGIDRDEAFAVPARMARAPSREGAVKATSAAQPGGFPQAAGGPRRRAKRAGPPWSQRRPRLGSSPASVAKVHEGCQPYGPAYHAVLIWTTGPFL